MNKERSLRFDIKRCTLLSGARPRTLMERKPLVRCHVLRVLKIIAGCWCLELANLWSVVDMYYARIRRSSYLSLEGVPLDGELPTILMFDLL